MFARDEKKKHNRFVGSKNLCRQYPDVLFRTRNLGQHFLDISKKRM
jgi:hypothetical protein